ncbi:restriction endonuclease [Elizabethkingia anophelis]|nr:restriction endonuclease [Elizabethkingia anophelis]
MITGNKGEWSEIYALLKIIGDKKIFAGDRHLNKIESVIFPIIKVLRDESNGTFEFGYENELVIIKNNKEEYRISIVQFQEQAVFLLKKLKESSNTTFSIPEIEDFINSFGSHSLKAKSTVKSDIRIVIHDHRTGMNPLLGFSIKSQLGKASTLLNASKATNFIYRVNANLTSTQISEINGIASKSKIKDRLDRIRDLGGSLHFERTESSIFGNNLILIDSSLPKIISEILLFFFTSNYNKTSDLIIETKSLNPLGYNQENSHPYYDYKIKRFLSDIALGMMPSKVWTGQYDATGGYLVIKENGDVLCYHIYNRNEFDNYLLANTRLETPSSTKHGFGVLYTENENIYLKLNLQIRFL